MTRRIHAYSGVGEMVRSAVEAAFPEREYVVWTDDETFAEGLGEAEALLALNPPRGHWGRATRLRLLQMPGAGIDSVLPAPELPADVRLANCRGIHEPEMAEFVFAQILAVAKHVPRAASQQRARVWKPYATRPLSAFTVGILGLGAIGASVAQYCTALGMRVIGTRASGAPLEGVERVYSPKDTLEVLSQSDVAVILLPRTPETANLIGEGALAAMPKGARLVNAGRGGIVDEAALVAALEEGQLAGASFDVFAEEPLPEASPLWDAPNLLITPHTAGLFPGYMDRVAEVFIENLHRIDADQPLKNEVPREKGY